jgi:hypothetical protein
MVARLREDPGHDREAEGRRCGWHADADHHVRVERRVRNPVDGFTGLVALALTVGLVVVALVLLMLFAALSVQADTFPQGTG